MLNQSSSEGVNSALEVKENSHLVKQDFRFHSGIEALPDAALVLSPELTIMAGNKKAQRLLGVRFPDNIGQHITELLIAPEFENYLEQDNFETPLSVTCFKIK